MSDDDALSRANKFLTVRKATDVAVIDNDAIAALLKEAEESTRPEPLPPVETKPQPRPQPPVQEPSRNPPPAVPAKPNVVVHSQTPGVTAEVLPPAVPTQGDAGSPQNINVVVNVAAPAAPYPYYPHPYWWGAYALCPRCHLHRPGCGRWLCPYYL